MDKDIRQRRNRAKWMGRQQQAVVVEGAIDCFTAPVVNMELRRFA